MDEEVEELEHVIEKQLEKDASRRHRRFKKLLECDEDDASEVGSIKSNMTNATNDTFKVRGGRYQAPLRLPSYFSLIYSRLFEGLQDDVTIEYLN